MKGARRFEVYLRQAGRITPRQRRRIRHKDNRAMKRGFE